MTHPGKRRSDGQLPPAKKHRPQQHYQNGSNPPPASKSNIFQSHSDHPTLPPIGPEYEDQVFTHQSALKANESASKLGSYERLEFLGDAYIEIIASRLLWNQFKDLPTGKLSYIRESLVKNETLAQFSKMYGLDKRLKAGQDFDGQGSAGWTKIKGDIFESYVAAVVLSDPVTGFETAEDWLTQLWLPKLKDVKTDTTNLKAKEELAKKVLAKGVHLNYVDERPVLLDKKGGVQTYFVGVYLTGWGWENQHLGSGKGSNKVMAGNEAAMRAMENKPLIDQVVGEKKEWLKKRDLEKENGEDRQ